MKLKHTHIQFVPILFLFLLILSSCSKDEESPSLTVNAPQEGSLLFLNDSFEIDFETMDNDELQSIQYVLTVNDVSIEKTEETTAKTAIFGINEVLNFEDSGELLYEVTVTDKSGNSSEFKTTYNYYNSPPGELVVNFKLQYDGEPLVMFQDYEYPDGRTMNFTRFSFYTGNVSLDNTVVNQIEFHNLTNNNADATMAALGYDWSLDRVPMGSYSNLNMGLGVPIELNAKLPGEYESGHPLARPAEHWFSWSSYIFIKVEGNLDTNSDGDKNEGLALHLGSDDGYRTIAFNEEIEIMSGQSSSITKIIDLFDFFGGDANTFDVDSNPQIHSLSQIDQVNELADNMMTAIK